MRIYIYDITERQKQVLSGEFISVIGHKAGNDTYDFSLLSPQ